MNCHQATQKLQALELLRTELGETLELLKDAHNQIIAGGITKEDKRKREEAIQTLKTKARVIKQELETGIKEMNREMLMFVVSDAVNPYREGLTEAGLPIDHPECKEKKEIAIDMEEVIAEHIQHYKDQNLPTWAEDIEENEELLIDILLDENEKEKIEKRIKAGMIPIVMPSRETQQRSWELSLNNLKPIWIENGEEITLNPTDIYKEGYNEKMHQFLASLPDRPYIVWVKPTKSVEKTNPEWKTTDLSFVDQQEKLKKLHKDHPDIVDEKDILPTEYATLQSFLTSKIKKRITEHNSDNPIHNLHPLDYLDIVVSSSIRFLSSGSLNRIPAVLGAFFNSRAFRMEFIGLVVDADAKFGFRPVARS